jgi:hypothetical protein
MRYASWVTQEIKRDFLVATNSDSPEHDYLMDESGNPSIRFVAETLLQNAPFEKTLKRLAKQKPDAECFSYPFIRGLSAWVCISLMSDRELRFTPDDEQERIKTVIDASISLEGALKDLNMNSDLELLLPPNWRVAVYKGADRANADREVDPVELLLYKLDSVMENPLGKVSDLLGCLRDQARLHKGCSTRTVTKVKGDTARHVFFRRTLASRLNEFGFSGRNVLTIDELLRIFFPDDDIGATATRDCLRAHYNK